jgi:cytochrome c oxidase assembly factor CtaG
MSPEFYQLLTIWDWRPEVLVPLLTLGVLYVAGWWRLRARGARQLAAGWRLAAYLGGLLLVALALLSPVEILSSWLFTAHMVQHLLLVMFAPPLLMVANPMPFILWGLPRVVREPAGRGLSRLLHRESSSRRFLRRATGLGIIWFAYTATLVLWHDPTLYDLALRREWIHNLEHLTFFGTAMLYWWVAIGAGPRVHKRAGLLGRTAFVLAALPVNWLLGISFALGSEPVFAHYAAMPRIGLGLLQDQILGGFIMWAPGSMMYILFALIMLGRYISREEQKPVRPPGEWGTEQQLAAPHIHKSQ